MNSSPNILVTYKKSRYEQYVLDEADPDVIRLLAEDHLSVRSLKKSHRIHNESLENICTTLDQRGLTYDRVYRGDTNEIAHYDLIISVGGDGTVLDLSHRIENTPMLAINSDPGMSVGFFSAGTASEFPELIDNIVSGHIQPVKLRRFAIKINGTRCGFPVLNDVLVTNSNPAAVSNYLLKVGEHPFEQQTSSGIWISTAAGSTGAIRSAGGIVLPVDSENLQYLVREPYPPKSGGYRFLKGIQHLSDPIEVISRMREGRVFLDGPHASFAFTIGDLVSVDPGAPSLNIYSLQQTRRTA